MHFHCDHFLSIRLSEVCLSNFYNGASLYPNPNILIQKILQL